MSAASLTFLACFIGTILLGIAAPMIGKRRRPAHASAALEDWGLGGRRFGTWITWFLVGGDFYTAYTVIAVPAMVYATGAYGFFALPYTIIVYPFVFAVMPRLWQAARDGGHVTAADLVRGRFGSRTLELAVALTGLVAVLPYIALQLVGIRVVLESLGAAGTLPLLAAFAALAIYTWVGGLRAPALTAFIKDVMIYVVVLVAVTVIPMRLGGYGAMFSAASLHLPPPRPGAMLSAGQSVPYASLALSSALAAFLYPHTLTGVLAARSADIIRRNAMLLPAYTLLLGLIALLGLMAHAAGIRTTHPSAVVPLLFLSIFPGWFAGFAFAAIAIGALVPASVMAIGAANLASRNLIRWPTQAAGSTTVSQETVARIAAFLVKLGGLGFVLFLNPSFAIDLQLLGGVWVLQTSPAVIACAWPRVRLAPPGLNASPGRAHALLCGWLVGMVLGTTLVVLDHLKPVHAIAVGHTHILISSALLALLANLVTTVLLVLVGNRLPERPAIMASVLVSVSAALASPALAAAPIIACVDPKATMVLTDRQVLARHDEAWRAMIEKRGRCYRIQPSERWEPVFSAGGLVIMRRTPPQPGIPPLYFRADGSPQAIPLPNPPPNAPPNAPWGEPIRGAPLGAVQVETLAPPMIAAPATQVAAAFPVVEQAAPAKPPASPAAQSAPAAVDAPVQGRGYVLGFGIAVVVIVFLLAAIALLLRVLLRPPDEVALTPTRPLHTAPPVTRVPLLVRAGPELPSPPASPPANVVEQNPVPQETPVREVPTFLYADLTASLLADARDERLSRNGLPTVAKARSEPQDVALLHPDARHPAAFHVACASVLSAAGWNATVVRASGSHHADVVARRGGRVLALRCLSELMPIDEDAVEEACLARERERADLAMIVSNGPCSSAARKLAAQTGIDLLREDELPGFAGQVPPAK